jgi:hypothetical protein
MRFVTDLIISAGTATGTTAVNSTPIDASNLFAGSVQLVIAGGGSPVGTLKLQFSNDPNTPLGGGTPTHWSDIASATVAVTADGTFGISKIDLAYQWIRAVYTNTSGTGTFDVRFKGSGF